ncbi:hypothetical protein [Metallosphaera hakonensis]|uniref:Uncharacterized protein n=1 Tax=Metallosphaera hakonensis JCM 8857 = DSM 7519 TaxID=1293036 RepID=A0A2U9IRN4_9CREN|nr:hypothetical protein [Metallosphaera hakonensis]
MMSCSLITEEVKAEWGRYNNAHWSYLGNTARELRPDLDKALVKTTGKLPFTSLTQFIEAIR